MLPNQIAITCFETNADIFTLKEAWEELHANCFTPSIYNTFIFIFQTIESFLNDFATWKVFTLTDQNTGELIAIFPMQQTKDYVLSLPVNTYTFIALNEIMDKPMPLIRKGFHDSCWQAFLSHLKNSTDCGHLFLRDLPSPHPTLDLLPKVCQQQNLSYQVEFDSENPLINLNADWEEFWQSHRNLRKKTRKLEKDFGDRLKYSVYDDNWQWCFEQYIKLETKSWKNGLGDSRYQHITDFYRALLPQFESADHLIFGFLSVDDEVIAGEFAYRCGDTVYFPQACYDPAYKKYSPSMVCTSLMIKHLYSSPFSQGDFLCGYADYFNGWSDTIQKTYDVNIYIKRPVIRLILSLRSIKKKVLGSIKIIRKLLRNNSSS